MKTTLFTLLQTVILAMLLVFNAPLQAASDTIDKQQAVSIAQQTYPGRVLSVKLIDDIYQVKILIDARSGKVITGS